MNVAVNETVMQRFLDDHKIVKRPSVRIVPAVDDRTGGRYYGNGQITLYVHPGERTVTQLADQVNRTLLHELRHHWQSENWDDYHTDDKPGSYWFLKHETDARDFADLNAHRYRLIRVVRPAQVSRGFARLSDRTRR